jgi:Uma2 family endonuclease
VAEYWVVDVDGRVVERWRPGDKGPEILDQRLIWQPDRAVLPLEIDLPAYFREVWAEEP